MGGSGSGRIWHCNNKKLTDDFPSLDIRWLHKQDLLTRRDRYPLNWHCGNQLTCSIVVQSVKDGLRLKYAQQAADGNWEHQDYIAPITWTSCHYGGERPWFLCPVASCSKRVAILYGGSVFACRHCHQLAYPSQREATDLRLLSKANKIRTKLGWQPAADRHGSAKPKYMHWTTYLALVEKHNSSLLAARENFEKLVRHNAEAV